MTLQELSGKTIFFSRKLKADSQFKKLAKENKIQLIDESLICTNEIRFSFTPKTDWIFFSSKNAIKYFFSQNPELHSQIKFGVMSQVSAAYLLKFGKIAQFIGEGVDLAAISKEFGKLIKDESVLFPQAIDSLKTIQKHLSFINTCYNLFVYKTTIKTNFTIPYCDILIFTSPSNVNAYFNKHKVETDQRVIAIGTSTKQKLSDYGIRDVLMPDQFSEEGLFDAVLKTEFTN
ncbi:MAG: uroporphyrinogen-III synthase [Bacteroidetes bacterium]|nr:uroporphyrinogen-III synthase [Bacteroidota bacterium]